MSLNAVIEYFKKYNMENNVMVFTGSTATVELASNEVGCKPSQIAKTLSFIVSDKPILIVVSGDAKIDNKKYKAEFNAKAKMIGHDDVEALIGHGVGGVCPFAINEGVQVFLDVSLKMHKVVYPACGSANSAIGLTINQLEKYSNFTRWVDVAKLIEVEN